MPQDFPSGARAGPPLSAWASGVADDDGAMRDVARDDASRADHGVVADRDAGEDDRAAADPHVVADTDRACALDPRTAQRGVERVRGRVELNPRPDLHVVANVDLGAVEEDAVVVDEQVAARADVEAVVAGEARHHGGAVADGAEQAAQDRVARTCLARRGGVVPGKDFLRPQASFHELGIRRAVGLAGDHLLAFEGHRTELSIVLVRAGVRTFVRSPGSIWRWGGHRMIEGYALFDTALGRCGIAWTERGVAGVQLPEPSDDATRARLRRRHPA